MRWRCEVEVQNILSKEAQQDSPLLLHKDEVQRIIKITQAGMLNTGLIRRTNPFVV